MKTKLASAFGLAMLAVAFSFSSSFACTTASVVESAVSESGMNVTPLAEASVPERQVGEVAALASVAGPIEAPSTEASAPPATAFADGIPVEITEAVTVVGHNSEDEEGPAIPASGIAGIEPSVTEESPQTAQIKVAEPAPVVAAVEPPLTDVNAPPTVVSVDAVPVEITETVTVVVPGQKSENDEGAAISAPGIAGIEPSVTEESSQTAAPESEAKAAPELSEQTGTAEGQIEVAEPAANLAAVEPPLTDVNVPPAVASVDAVPVEITETMTVAVPGQKSEDNDDVEITEPQHPAVAPNLNRDETTAALDDGE
jgi:hypothetical protein